MYICISFWFPGNSGLKCDQFNCGIYGLAVCGCTGCTGCCSACGACGAEAAGGAGGTGSPASVMLIYVMSTC